MITMWGYLKGIAGGIFGGGMVSLLVWTDRNSAKRMEQRDDPCKREPLDKLDDAMLRIIALLTKR